MTPEEEAAYKASEKMRVLECLSLVGLLDKKYSQADVLTILAMATGLCLKRMCKTEREFTRGCDKVTNVVRACRTMPLPSKK